MHSAVYQRIPVFVRRKQGFFDTLKWPAPKGRPLGIYMISSRLLRMQERTMRHTMEPSSIIRPSSGAA